MLTRREQSRFELGLKLERSAPSELVVTVLDELRDRGFQSDQRYAEMLARARFNSGKGPLKLQAELSEHRIDESIVEDVMAEYEGSWKALSEEVRVKKFGAKPPRNYPDWARQARFLQQRGFGMAHIRGFDGGAGPDPQDDGNYEDN